MREHLNYLDGLRGLACLMVAACHFYALFGYVFWGTDVLASKTDIFYSGPLCVRLFFIVSSFLLSASLYQSISVEKIRDTIVKRYLRLTLPILAVTLLIFIMEQLHVFYNMNLTDICNDPDYTGGYTTQHPLFKVFTTSLCTTIFNGDITFNNKFWMMTYLFYGNLLSLAVTLLTRGRKRMNLIFFSVLIVLVLFADVYYFPFVLGTLLAYLYIHENNRQTRAKWNGVFWTSVIIIGLCLIELKGYLIGALSGITGIGDSVVHFFIDGNFYNSIALFFIVLAIMKLVYMQKIFGWKPFVKLGHISYYVFLVHWPIMCSLSAYLYLQLADDTNRATVSRLIFVITMVVIILVSWLFTATCEKWCSKFTKYVIRKMN